MDRFFRFRIVVFVISFFCTTQASADTTFVSQPMTWQDAQNYAQTNFNYGELISINSEDDQQFTIGLDQGRRFNFGGFSLDPFEPFWLGYNDIVQEGLWQWSDGSNSSYTNWFATEPNNSTNANSDGEDAAIMYEDGTWNDVSVNATFPFYVSHFHNGSGQIRYQFFNSVPNTIQSLDDYNLEDQTVHSSGALSDFDISQRPAGIDDNFAFRFSGEFLVPGGEITFKLISDDGSRLYIDGKVVILNDGLHGSSTPYETTLTLSRGWHSIRLDYFEKGGAEVLELKYKMPEMTAFESLSTLLLNGGSDADNDGYSDLYDRIYFHSCDPAKLSDSSFNDFRGCDFDGQDFPDGTYYNKFFDRSTFDGTNLINVTFIDSSFKQADFSGQSLDRQAYLDDTRFSDNPFVTFINAKFNNADIEAHWIHARFYNVNFSGASISTADSENYDSDWICYEFGHFLNTDLIRYDDLLAQSGFQGFQLGVPGVGGTDWFLEIANNWEHPCTTNISIDNQASISELDNVAINIAPTVFMQDKLRTYTTSTSLVIQDFEYPVFGNDEYPAFRSNAEASPIWSWDTGNYYQIDKIRIYKDPAHIKELDDAVVLISDWPFDDDLSPLVQSDFDSIIRHPLEKTSKPYYEISIDSSLRYIRIQRPVNGSNQLLSLKKVELYGNSTPLAGATAEPPASFKLPLYEEGRSDCKSVVFDIDKINKDFDVVAATQDIHGYRLWSFADLSQEGKRGFDFEEATLENVNFEQTDLFGANFRNANIRGTNFRGANLEEVDFRGATLLGSDFRGANLKNAKFGSTDISCAYFTGELPASYSQLDESNTLSMISVLAGDRAYGYARASSIDLSTFPALATDNDINTSSISAQETSPWWELDMGAVYLLSDITLDTGHDLMSNVLGTELTSTEQLELFVSDWPLPLDFVGLEIPGRVFRVTDFEIDASDSSIIHFNTAQTGRYIHVRGSSSLGVLRLSLAEVSAQTPVIPNRPSSPLPLTPSQAATVPETQQLLNRIDSLIYSYQEVNAGDSIFSARETIIDLINVSANTIDGSAAIIRTNQNFRKILRPIGTLGFFLKRLKIISALKPTIDNILTIMKPLFLTPKALSALSFANEQHVKLINKSIVQTINAAVRADAHIASQVAILKTGRSYIDNILNCSLNGAKTDQVRIALETYSKGAAGRIESVNNEIVLEQKVIVATQFRRAKLFVVNEFYALPHVQDLFQTSADALEAMGPLAAAITPMQRLFAGGVIYEDITIWDAIDLFAEAVELYGSLIDEFLAIPVISDIVNVLNLLFEPIFDLILSSLGTTLDVLFGPGGLLVNTDILTTQFNNISDEIESLSASLSTKQVYTIPSLPTDVFAEVMNISEGDVFSACKNKLNLPEQWPVATNDDDGDSLTNAFEVGYAPDSINAVTNTLANNPDSDLDGLDDYFEWYWSTQAGSNATFDPQNGTLGEADRDDDNDGLTSIEENIYNTNPYDSDTDGDGISDGDEVEWGTNPKSAQGDLSDLQLDLDGDGVFIAQELVYGLDPINLIDVFEDHDGDGVTTDDEILQGSSPIIKRPVQILNTIRGITNLEQLSNEVTIDLNNWLEYTGSDAMVIDTVASSITEGTLTINNPSSLSIRYTLDASNQNSRHVLLLIKVNSEGGSVLLSLQIQVSNPVDQSISFPALADKTIVDSGFVLSATATSGLSVSFVSTTSSVCSVNESTVTLRGLGTCSITASQTGDFQYKSAPDVIRSFNVTKVQQTISFSTLGNKTVVDPDFDLSATASSALAVSYVSTTPSVCSVNTQRVAIYALGTCSITASQAGNAVYNAAVHVVQSFSVTKSKQTINFSAISDKILSAPDFNLSAKASSGLTIDYVSTTPLVCSVNDRTIAILTLGKCSITASQSGDSRHFSAKVVTRVFFVKETINPILKVLPIIIQLLLDE